MGLDMKLVSAGDVCCTVLAERDQTHTYNLQLDKRFLGHLSC